jgi:hypothetical protein
MTRFFTFLFLALLVTSACWSDSPDQSTSDKIKELQQRIEQLEKEIAAKSGTVTQAELDELKRQVAILAEEVEKLRSGETTEPLSESDRRALGLGPSASTVYTKKQGVSLAGYGEMLYENFAGEDQSGVDSEREDQIDFLRGVIYFGYRFNDRFLFNSEIEFEHANTADGGEAGIEFAFVDFRAADPITIRGGMVLIPMGLINEFHEPNVFLGARRPLTETRIIPTTWRENGAGIVGRKGIFDYRAYLTNGFNSAGFTDDGLAGGKQEGALAKIRTPSFVGRVDVTPTEGLYLGASVFGGQSGFFTSTGGEEEESRIAVAQDELPVAPQDLNIGTFISEFHGAYRYRGIDLRGLYAYASLNHVEELNLVLGLEGDESVGKTMDGGYIQAGYNLLANRSQTKAALIPYFRYEAINTQRTVPAGFSKNGDTAIDLTTFGVQYEPIPGVVLKTDYQIIHNDAKTGVNQWNIDLGYSF